MSVARNLSKMINKENYITHSGHSSVSGLDMPTETSMVGMITSFSMTTASDWRATNRWLICDGSAISRTTYSDLFLVVGTTWGVGDGSSTFNLPDLRGEFLRGTDNGRLIDSGRTVGTTQGHGIPKLEGSVNNYYNSMYSSTGIFQPVAGDNVYGGGNGNGGRGFTFTSTDVIPDSPEVRPRNVAVLYCIKY